MVPAAAITQRAALAALALGLAGLADHLAGARESWVLTLYALPLIVSIWLPTLGVLITALATLVTLSVFSVLAEGGDWSPARLAAFVQVVLLAGMAFLVRTSRDDVDRSNRRVSGILDGSNTGFVRTAPDLTVLDANGPWLRMVGARRVRDLVGSRLTDWFPEDQRRTAEAMLAFLDEGDRRSFEAVIRQRSGLRIHVVVTAYAERLGDRVEIAAVFADVTAIRRAEAQARASEQQLRSHLENTPLAAVVLDASHHIREWNRAAEQVFGYSRQTALGSSAWELVPPEERGQRSSPFGQTPSESGDGSHRVTQLTRDGRTIVIQWYHTPLRSPSGEITQVASLGLDVTRQRRIEQALRVSEVKFSSVFQQSPDALLLIRPRDEHLLEANETVERAFGWSRADLFERWNAYGEFFASARDLERFRALIAEHERVESFETELMTRDGQAVPVLLSSRRLQIEGSPALLLTIRDVTGIREAEAERYRLQEQLQQAQRLEGIGRLAGGVAHDFNNMLAGIQGYAELIEGQRSDANAVTHYAERILDTTQRAADLVSKLLTFSRQGAIEKRYFDLSRVVADTLDLLSQTLDPRVEVECALTEEAVAVYGDESQISNALLNLCINARDAMPEGGHLVVRTALEALDDDGAASLDPELVGGDYVVLSVRDEGVGMDARQLEDIFVPFYTTKPKGQGTGLGLPSVYGAVKAHGGTVRVSSKPGAGSTFSLYLPAWPASQIQALEPEQAAGEPDLAGREVLVVDDEPDVRETLARSLERTGCSVTTAADGREALACFEADPQRFSLVILDLIMPAMPGDEVFEHLRALRPEVDVILMSGFDRTAVLQRVLGEGAAGVLKKPFTREELLREIDRILRTGPPDSSPRLRVVKG
jgi:PAS domain S-box-containing protein